MNNLIRNTVIASTLFSTLFAVSLPVLALKEDSKKPITIDSSRQSLDLTGNVATFTDNVIVKQGSIDIRADKVVVTRPEGDAKKTVIEAYGNPATFYQMLDDGKPIKGHSSKMRYEMDKELITLTDNAYLEQLDSNIKGDRITYLVPTQQMEAFSDKGKRVTTVLLPSQLQEKGPSAQGTDIHKADVQKTDVQKKSK
ncbi:lipopolysaccharide ABC transporter substrate-binding protein LptA [Xenorhabdus littoralis]|uniref:lipopolysaccharide ABC transporter substrate-binding protein LptA n=1 Tax=Xenorhabdus littoralis TaxID=2582835 RepID=UPI0029E7F5C0|nr:lipopolysaccharide ABC transporter substrate-binding protein LptA [Xenorhabdus sp. psl]MDX7990603.1 lipopolysaccharide ABC transporter substrate-binding protein LptA [Xenorhabdus sp. psl]